MRPILAGSSPQIQWMFVVDVFRTDGAQLVPEIQDRGHDDGNSYAYGKEDPVRWQEDEQGHDGTSGDDKGGTPLQRDSETWVMRHAESILVRLS